MTPTIIACTKCTISFLTYAPFLAVAAIACCGWVANKVAKFRRK